MTYGSLAEWRLGMQVERLAGVDVGMTADPLFAEGLRLGSGSPVLDRAIDLEATFGIQVGAHDFFGGAVPRGAGYDLGAHEL